MAVHYIPIPTIDDCNLPNNIIDKCYNTYTTSGKQGLYEILNNELASARFPYKERNRYLNIDLIKRYLYLYRIAMVQTMSYAYNTEEFELNDFDIYKDDDEKCPKCGETMTVLPQRGTTTYFPYSHYDDIVEKFVKTVTFTKFPVKGTLSISFKEFMSDKISSEISDYKFMHWSINKDGTTDFNVNDPVGKFLSEDGKLYVWASYASSATATGNKDDPLLSTEIKKTIKYTYDVTVQDFIGYKIDRPTKNNYKFSYYTFDDGAELPDPLSDDELKKSIYELLNEDYALETVYIFAGDEEKSDFVIDIDSTVKDLQDLVGSSEKENYIFKGFTYEKYDEQMREIVIKYIDYVTTNSYSYEKIISKIPEDLIPWDYMDKTVYNFDYWTINEDGSEMTEAQLERSVSTGTKLRFYAVFHNVYDETCRVVDMQNVYADEWGADTVVLYSHYSYDIKEGTYCYDDRAYNCSNSDFIWKEGPELVFDKSMTLKDKIKEYSLETYGLEDGHPDEVKYEDFYGWSLSTKNYNMSDSDLSKTYAVGYSIKLYAVYRHDHKFYGIGRLKRYTDDCICPICGKKVSYIGNYSEGTHKYEKDGYLKILRYTRKNGVLGWYDSYKNGNNETLYGTVLDVSSISTLEELNKSTVIQEGTTCVDTSVYADSSNTSYKIYIYNSRRDSNYDPTAIYEDEDVPADCEYKWIVVPDDVEFIFLDTTGANKTKYIIQGFYKCYLSGNGDLKVVKMDSKGRRLSASLISVANTFGLDSSISVEIIHEDDKYKASYDILLSGYSIENENDYDNSEKAFKEINKKVDITYAETPSKYLGEYPNSVSTWGDKYIDEEGFINDGGYPTADSIRTMLKIVPGESYKTGNGLTLNPVNVFGLKPLTREMQMLFSSIIVSGGIANTEGNAGSTTEGNVIVKDPNGNIVDGDDYSGLNYSGWHWVAEDTTRFYTKDSLDDKYTFKVTNNEIYPVLISTLLTYSEENITYNGKSYKFYEYSIDGYTPISKKQLESVFVPAKGSMIIYKIYVLVDNVYGIGLVESDIFGNDKEFMEGGFKRVLFISEYNSTGSLVRYCSNPSCYRLMKPLYQRKWSFRDGNAFVKNTAMGNSIPNFSLDDYNFSTSNYNKSKIENWSYEELSDLNKRVVAHRGGSGDIDDYRFDFEYKYATDEYNPKKNAIPATVASSKYKSYVLQNIMGKIKGTKIVPMVDRPLKIYQDRYKEHLFKRFKEIWSRMVKFTPFTILNKDEINVMSEILQGLTYDLRLRIIAFINTWNDYTSFSLNEWKDEKYQDYLKTIKKNFELKFNTNRVMVSDGVPMYIKKTILNSMIIPKFNTLYSFYLDPDSAQIVESYKIAVSPKVFGTDSNTISKGAVLDREIIERNVEDPKNTTVFDMTKTDETKYDFVRITLNESGEESTYDDLNEFVSIGDDSYVTIYVSYIDKNMTEIREKSIDSSWFNSYEDFVNKYYQDDEFISETQLLLTNFATDLYLKNNPGAQFYERYVDGVDKLWFSKVYNDDEITENTLEDYVNSYEYQEFNSILRDIVNVSNEEIYYDTKQNEGISLDDILTDMENKKLNSGDETRDFAYWSFDGITKISANVRIDRTRKYAANTTVKLYKVYRLKNEIEASTFNRNWYNGESLTYETIKEYLSEFHEKFALPISFMSYMIGLMIWPKRFIAMTASNGEVGSYFLSANYMVESNSKSDVLMHRTGTSGNSVFKISISAISERFPAAFDTATGDAIYEQYFIISETNGSNYKIYSFMKNAWIDEVFSGSEAYNYCYMLKNTENPIFKYSPNKLIKIIPYSTNEDYSILMLVYDTCIVFFDCFKNNWISDRTVGVSDLFGTNVSMSISGVTYNRENGTVYILSSRGGIITYDIDSGKFSGEDHKFVRYDPENKELYTASEEEYILSQATVVKEEGADGGKTRSTEIDSSAVLAIKVADLSENVEIDRPWIMDDKYSITPVLLKEITDAYYNNLSSDDQKKYNLKEEFTLRYAFENAKYSYDNTVDRNGSSYTFKRLSFYTNGISISDSQLNSRLKNSIGLYAIYNKDGVEISEKEGLTIAIKEYSTRKEPFLTDLKNYNGEFDAESTYGEVNDPNMPSSIDSIYALEGFKYSDGYLPVIAMVSGNIVKICRWNESNKFSVINTINYRDGSKVMAIIPADNGRKTYIVYENQRIVQLSTYKYSPSIFKEASTTGEKVTVVGSNFNIDTLYINYYTNKNEVHCVQLDKDTYRNDMYYGRQIDVPKYISGDLTTYSDVKIDQTNFDFYAPFYPKWKTLPGEKYELSKIN